LSKKNDLEVKGLSKIEEQKIFDELDFMDQPDSIETLIVTA
jgi:hypothetical protein